MRCWWGCFWMRITRLNTCKSANLLCFAAGRGQCLMRRERFPSYKYLCCQVVRACGLQCVGWVWTEAKTPFFFFCEEVFSSGCVQVAFSSPRPRSTGSPLYSADLSLMARGLWTCLLNTSSWDFTASGLVLGKGDELVCCLFASGSGGKTG